MVFRNLLKRLLLLAVLLIGIDAAATAPVSGNYYIKNVGLDKYMKVTGKYSAEPDAATKASASKIYVGVDSLLTDGTYQMNSLASTYGVSQTPVECYDYVGTAIKIGTSVLKQQLQDKGVSDDNVLKAVDVMTDFINDYAYMRLKPVEGKADTYLSVNTIPSMEADENGKKALDAMVQLGVIKTATDAEAWEYLKSLVKDYLDGAGSSSQLKNLVLNNIDKVSLGKTYLLGGDTYNTLDYTEYTTEAAANPLFQWKLIPYTPVEQGVSGTYKISNVGNGKYVKVLGKYSAEPNYSEAEASDIHITSGGTTVGLVAGTTATKVTSLGATAADGSEVEISDYVTKAIKIGGYMVETILNQSETLTAAKKQEALNYLNDFVTTNAYMVVEPIGGTNYVWTYATLPVIPDNVKDVIVKYGKAMGSYAAPTSRDEVWQYLLNLVRYYLNDEGNNTDSGLKSLVLRNIGNLKEGATYFLKADADGTFGYTAVEAGSKLSADQQADASLQWGLDLEVSDATVVSGTYVIRNVGNSKYVKVLGKYNAEPNYDEANATEIKVTTAGSTTGLVSGVKNAGTKITSLGATAADGTEIEISDYVTKAIKIGAATVQSILDQSDLSDAKKKEAQQYLTKFVTDNAYMVVEPVSGTEYVWAYGTLPVIPDSVKAVIVKYGKQVGHYAAPKSNDEVWQYLINLVHYYLDNNSGTDSNLKNLVLANIDKTKEGMTYYLKADADGSFGYVAVEAGSELTTAQKQDNTLWWGMDVKKVVESLEDGFYKIHNIGLDTYVKVEQKYYARPNVTKEEATPIHVGLNAQKADGSYDLNSLAGATPEGLYVECYDYVDKAINIGKIAVEKILAATNTSDENIAKADEYLANFVKQNAYMTVRAVPGKDNAYYAYATIPEVPAEVQDVILKKAVSFGSAEEGNYVAAPTTADEIWPYLKGIVKYYLSKNNTDSKLKSLVLNNIDKIELGHTYYLCGDADLTFGLVDATVANFSDETLQWGFDSAVTPEPFAGYYRIANADGNTYVNVVSHFIAKPNTSEADARVAAGSVIYVKAEESKDGVSMPISNLRSQGIQVVDYLDGIQTCLNAVSAAAVTVLTEEVQKTSYAKYSALVEPIIDDIVDDIDLHLYVEPTITAQGKPAYFLTATVPDVNEWLTTANEGLSMLGKNKQWLHDKVAGKLGTIDQSGKGKLKQAVLDLIQVMDDTDAFWKTLKTKGLNMLNNEDYMNALKELLPAEALEMLRDNLDKVEYGTTYCFTKGTDGTMDIYPRNLCESNEAAKWVLIPFSQDDINYDATAYNQLGVNTEVSYTAKTRPSSSSNYKPLDMGTYYFTTGIYDFDAQIQSVQGKAAEAYIAVETKDTTWVESLGANEKATRVCYLVRLEKVDGVIPAHTPVVLRTKCPAGDEPNIALLPVNTPTTDAIESDDVISSSKFYQQMSDKDNVIGIFKQLLGSSSSSAPRKVTIPDANFETNGNNLVGTLLTDENIYGDMMPLKVSEQIEAASSTAKTLYMSGLGFWTVDELPELQGNKAYFYAEGETGYTSGVTNFFGQNGQYAPGYILNFVDGTEFNDWTVTGVSDVTAAKTVQNVTYFSVAGQQSAQPFEGVNIVVTRYTDGTQAVSKVVK